jgi:hypothetical protein
MQIHHELATPSTLHPASASGADFLGARTFLRPSFRISVEPRQGELSVAVRASAVPAPRPSVPSLARH